MLKTLRRDIADLVMSAAQYSRRLYDKDGTLEPVAVCAYTLETGIGIPVASYLMDGVKPNSQAIASAKCWTVVAHRMDTLELSKTRSQWSDWDLLACQAAGGRFCPWGGGIQLFRNSELVGALAISGRSELGDHVLALYSAVQYGFRDKADLDGFNYRVV